MSTQLEPNSGREPLEAQARQMCAPGIQLKLALILLFSQAAFCGCAHQYLIKLSNGDQLLSYSKPKKQWDSHHFTGETGVKCMVPQNRVVKIKSVSVVKEEPKPPPPPPKKPKHWYFLWLA